MANEFKVLGLPDYLTLPNGECVAASQASTSMADDNLITEEPSEFWRSLTNKPSDCVFNAGTRAFTNTFKVSGIGLVSHNLRLGSGLVRFATALSSITLANFYEELAPDAVISTVNTAMVIGDVNEAFSPDGAWATPTTTGDIWSFILSFPTPAQTPPTGANKMIFGIFVRCKEAVTDMDEAPRCHIALLQGSTGGTELTEVIKPVTSTTGQWLFLTWNSSLLAAADGSDARIKVLFEPISSTQYVECDTVGWRTEKATSGGFADCNSDSGWISPVPVLGMPSDPSTLIRLPEEEDPLNSYLHTLSAVDARNVYCFMLDDQVPDEYVYDRATFKAPTGYVEAGKILAGLIFTPTYGYVHGEYVGIEDHSSQQRTEGGQEFGSRRATSRVMRAVLAHLTPAEAHFILDRWYRRKGVLGPVLVSLNPGDATEGVPTTMYSTLRSAENWMSTNPAENYGRSLMLELEEKL